MKRYRFTSFVLDSNRSLLKHPKGVSGNIREQILAELKIKCGDSNFDEKLKRYLELETGNIKLVTDYHQLLHEAEDTYVCGYYYPVLTASCCLGERIFNSLILRLREYYKCSKSYKKIYRKDGIQNWDLAIEVLQDWNIIDDHLADIYDKLHKVRIEAVHLKAVRDFRAEALFALQQIMEITDALFGLRKDIFFWVPGEPYIRKNKEEEPIVKEFFIPNCTLLGYKHSVRSLEPSPRGIGMMIDDPYDYEQREITDEEFVHLREEWRKSRGKSDRH